MGTKKTVDLGYLITIVFKEAANQGTLFDTFNQFVKGWCGADLPREVLRYVAEGVKEGMTCCGRSPEVQFCENIEFGSLSLFLHCGVCGAYILSDSLSSNETIDLEIYLDKLTNKGIDISPVLEYLEEITSPSESNRSERKKQLIKEIFSEVQQLQYDEERSVR